MTAIVRGIILFAAFLFIAISASMNAVFLSSFGRSALETGLFAGISVAADAVKAVLPVVLMRALMLRAWGHAAITGGMLVIVVALSLTSGLGFSALTRTNATSARESETAALASRQTDLAAIERQIGALGNGRSAALIEIDIEALRLEPAWLASNGCTRIGTAAARGVCGNALRLRGEHVTATERAGLNERQQKLRAEIERLRGAGAGTDSDPQAGALALLLGTDRATPRVMLMTALAVVLELGAVILVLIAAQPALHGTPTPTPKPKPEPKPPLQPVRVPFSADREHWVRQREAKMSADVGGTIDAR